MRIGEVLGMMIAPGLKPAEDRRSSGPQMVIPGFLSWWCDTMITTKRQKQLTKRRYVEIPPKNFCKEEPS